MKYFFLEATAVVWMFSLSLFIFPEVPVYAQSSQLASPNGKLKLLFNIQNNPTGNGLYYQFTFENKTVIEPSRLHLDVENSRLMQQLQIFHTTTSQQDTSWKPVYGERSQVRDRYAAHGLQYIHFDAGWYGHEYEVSSDATKVNVDPRRNSKGDLDLQEAIRYAKSKDIGVFLYVNHRALERQLDSILPLYKNWGVAGIKFGFVHTGSHRWTTWLHEAVRKCAAYQLMVNIHDDYRPTGFSRTYPNLMTQEGIRGNEEFPDATHNTVLPFTRFVAGAADYTFCYYSRKEFGHDKRFIKTTPCHQLALPVIYYSPLQWLFWYDRPSSYKGEPEIAFWEKMPTVWDDTRVIGGEIGQYITIARRKGEEWYIGTITNNDGRTLSVPLQFLEKGRKYTAQIYEDGDETVKTRTHVKESHYIVDNTSILQSTLLPGGGQAIRIMPAIHEEIRSLPKWRSATKQK